MSLSEIEKQWSAERTTPDLRFASNRNWVLPLQMCFRDLVSMVENYIIRTREILLLDLKPYSSSKISILILISVYAEFQHP